MAGNGCLRLVVKRHRSLWKRGSETAISEYGSDAVHFEGFEIPLLLIVKALTSDSGKPSARDAIYGPYCLVLWLVKR